MYQEFVVQAVSVSSNRNPAVDYSLTLTICSSSCVLAQMIYTILILLRVDFSRLSILSFIMSWPHALESFLVSTLVSHDNSLNSPLCVCP